MPVSSPTKKPTKAQLKAAEQTQQLLAALRSARDADDYPLTINALAVRATLPATDALKILSGKPLQSELLVAAPKDLLAPLVFLEDLSRLANADALFAYVGAKVRGKRSAGNKPLATDAKKLVTDAGLHKALKPEFEKALAAQITDKTVPLPLAELLIVKLSPQQIAAKLLAALTQHEQSLPESPLVAQSGLLANVKLPATDKDVKAALKLPEFAQQVLVCDGAQANKKDPAYILRSALALRLPQLVSQAIDWKVANTKGTTIFTAGELATVFFGKKQSADFAKSIEHYCDTHPQLAPEVGWLRIKGRRQFFRRQDVEPTASAIVKPSPPASIASPPATSSPADFAALFDAAFARLDARQGHRNYLKVHDLRQELSQFPRAQFDAGLRQLRIADKYTMEGASGTLPLTDDERAAGIQEGPLLLIYISKVK